MKHDNEYIEVLYTDTEDEFEPKFMMNKVSKELLLRASTVSYWMDTYGLNKYVKRISGKDRLLSMYEVNILRKIKFLRYDKGLRKEEVVKEIAGDIKILEEKSKTMKNENTEISTEVKDDIQHTNTELNIDQLTQIIANSVIEEVSLQLSQRLSTQISLQLGDKLEKQKNEILKEIALSSNTIDSNIQNTLKNHSEVILDTLERFEGNMSTQVEDALKTQINDFKQYMDKQELEFKEKDEKTIEFFREQMQKKEDKIKELEEEKNRKGFLSKLFGR